MNKTVLALSACVIIALAGCGGGGGGGGDSGGDDNGNGNNNGNSGTKLGLLAEQVKLFMPYLSGSSSSGSSSDLSDWDCWDPGISGTVLGKLFNPGNGNGECIHNLIEMLDSHIQLVNQFSDLWSIPGTYVLGNMTATVDTAISTLSIPFLNADFPGDIDRLVTLSVPDQGLTIHMAFAQNSGNQTIVEQYSAGSGEAGVFLARIAGSRIQVWTAAYGDSRVQIMWECDTIGNWFRITEASDASGGNWEVMGGGSNNGPAAKMAFISRNNLNNASIDEYYLTITMGDLENGLEQQILNAHTNPPSSSTDTVLSYLIDDSFFIDPKYPDSFESLAWSQ